jgi:hypothetical protein
MHADHVLYLQCKMTDMGIAAHMEHMSEGRDREERSRPIFYVRMWLECPSR